MHIGSYLYTRAYSLPVFIVYSTSTTYIVLMLLTIKYDLACLGWLQPPFVNTLLSIPHNCKHNIRDKRSAFSVHYINRLDFLLVHEHIILIHHFLHSIQVESREMMYFYTQFSKIRLN
jgi:hypothetical protein